MLCVLFVLLHKLLFILVCNFIFNLEVYYLIPNCMISMKTKTKIIYKTEKCPPSVCSCALLILIRCCCYLTSHPFPLHRPGVISNCNSGFFSTAKHKLWNVPPFERTFAIPTLQIGVSPGRAVVDVVFKYNFSFYSFVVFACAPFLLDVIHFIISNCVQFCCIASVFLMCNFCLVAAIIFRWHTETNARLQFMKEKQQSAWRGMMFFFFWFCSKIICWCSRVPKRRRMKILPCRIEYYIRYWCRYSRRKASIS